MIYKSPYPWFGGKSRVAPVVWRRFGKVQSFVDPFFGSLAMLLGRPEPWSGAETVNDADGFLCNFWRAVQADPEDVAKHADWPVNENDLHARHIWLVSHKDSIVAQLEGDPDWCDPKVAGWWVWGQCSWIGGGWCSGRGPWRVVEGADGVPRLARSGDDDDDGEGDGGDGVWRQRPHLTGRGEMGIKRQRVHLLSSKGIKRQRVHLGNDGRGVNRQLVHLGDAGQSDINGNAGDGSCGLHDWMLSLSDRLRRVRVCCGDWSRVCGPTVLLPVNTDRFINVGVFLDPPYSDLANRDKDIYSEDSQSVAHDVRKWAIEWGEDPRLRIVLCGYEGEHAMPDSWDKVEWKTGGGYGRISRTGDNANARRERLWFSPHCLHPSKSRPVQGKLFDFSGV